MIRWNRYSFFLYIARREFRAIATSYSVLLVLVGGVFAYGLLYNYMYAPNVVREVPVVVVDHSHSALSRDYIRMLDATPEADMRYQAQDMLEAKRLMLQAKAYGILYLPRDFEERMLRGDEAVYPFYATTDAFLYYESLERANLEVMEAMDGAYRMQLMEFLSVQGLAAAATQNRQQHTADSKEGNQGDHKDQTKLAFLCFFLLHFIISFRCGSICFSWKK